MKTVLRYKCTYATTPNYANYYAKAPNMYKDLCRDIKSGRRWKRQNKGVTKIYDEIYSNTVSNSDNEAVREINGLKPRFLRIKGQNLRPIYNQIRKSIFQKDKTAISAIWYCSFYINFKFFLKKDIDIRILPW